MSFSIFWQSDPYLDPCKYILYFWFSLSNNKVKYVSNPLSSLKTIDNPFCVVLVVLFNGTLLIPILNKFWKNVDLSLSLVWKNL